MEKLLQAVQNPGLWLAAAAVIVNLFSKKIAQKLQPDDEQGRLKVILTVKSGSLLLAVIGFIIVAAMLKP